MLAAAWNTVTTKIVVNCFRKIKLLNETQKVTIAEDNDPFKELEEEFENQRSIQSGHVSGSMDGASFTNIHAEVLAVQPLLLALRLKLLGAVLIRGGIS